MLLFDVDGTLTDTTDVDGQCFTDSVRAVLGVELTSHWNEFEQVTDAGIALELLREHPTDEQARLSAELERDFLRRLERQAAEAPQRFAAIPGAPELLDRLARRGTPFRLATGAWRSSATFKLSLAGLGDYAPACTSSETPVRREIFERAAEGATSVTLIGDGLWDARVARELGWRLVARADADAAETLRRAGASDALPDFRDLDHVARALPL